MKKLLGTLLIYFSIITYSVAETESFYIKKLSDSISTCWSTPMGIPNEDNLIVEAVLTLFPNGELSHIKILDQERMNKPGQGAYRVIAESIIRASKICAPFEFPEEDYEKWRKVVLKFDVRKIVHGVASIEKPKQNNEKNSSIKDPKEFSKPEEFYEYVVSFLKIGDYISAANGFKIFVNNYPKHQLAGDAQYWYAETFRIRRLWTDAAKAYLYGYENFQNSTKTPINFLKLGVSLSTIGEVDMGCSILFAVKKEYPNSSKSVLKKAEYEINKFKCKNFNSNWKNKIPSLYAILNVDSTDQKISKEEQRKIAEEEQKRIEDEKRKIAEEKKKIEDEKRKIAEAKKRKKEKDKDKKKKIRDDLFIIGTGTGFFVDRKGHVITNEHVAGICLNMVSRINGKVNLFDIIATDANNDLALLKGNNDQGDYLNINSYGADFGEDIVAFGYPLSQDLSSSVKLTRGIVSSLSGPENNIAQIQIDAAIQPGNSGGPVLNYEGQVIGVASSGLNKLYMLEKQDYIPENVNFAVAAQTLTSFLKSNRIKFSDRKIRIKTTKDLAKVGMPSTMQLLCLNTKAAHQKLMKNKKHSDVLLEKVINFK